MIILIRHVINGGFSNTTLSAFILLRVIYHWSIIIDTKKYCSCELFILLTNLAGFMCAYFVFVFAFAIVACA